MIKNTEGMPFKKFVQYILRKLYHENTSRINGTFKDMVTGDITDGDIFEANLVGKRTLEETYKAYLEWWNYIKYPHENERGYVSVKLVEITAKTGGNQNE